MSEAEKESYTELLEKRSKKRAEDIRGVYYRDQTAIIHSRPFRRLKHKTQVFFSPDDDHVCTRIEHVLHVASIAATICRGLKSRLSFSTPLNEDLAYSIGLGHDLGHAPFGHAGEDAINKIIKHSRFVHEINSYRVVEKLANLGNGLNLTYAVKDGIICHNGEKFERTLSPEYKIKDLDTIRNNNNRPSTPEGCIVRFSDKIAYLGRDIEDAVIASFIKKDSMPEIIKQKIGTSNGEIINYLILDLIKNSTEEKISFSEECFELFLKLKEFNYINIYRNEKILEFNSFCKNIVEVLYNYLKEKFIRYAWDHESYMQESSLLIDKYFANYLRRMKHFYEREERERKLDQEQLTEVLLTDYVSGMTDKFAIDSMKEISIPKPIEFYSRFRG